MKEEIIAWCKKEVVLLLALLAAMITTFWVPMSFDYIDYLDLNVLAILFCLMLVIKAMQKILVFEWLSYYMLARITTTRGLLAVLTGLCFFTSMWITNDVALITFVPLTIIVLDKVGQRSLMIVTIVLQTIAANLGSMLTPVGNPQNLFLYERYGIGIIEFIRITAPITTVSFFLLGGWILLMKNHNIAHFTHQVIEIPRKPLMIYAALFVVCLLTVVHILSYQWMLIIIVVVVSIVDKYIFKEVDYSLLGTFVCFFVFVGNIGSIEQVQLMMRSLLQGREIWCSILASQVISNVPAAVLLASFTEQYTALIVGTNIGGLGTLIASLASLISFKIYLQEADSNQQQYMIYFTIMNLIFLSILMLFSWKVYG